MKVRNAVSGRRALKVLTSTLFGMALALTGNAFTVYNSNMEGFDPEFDLPVPPAADYSSTPDNDFSSCTNVSDQNNHWAWPVNAGQVTITYAFDSSFDNLFSGPGAAATEAAVKAQIVQAMNQWSTVSSTSYGNYDSYARASSLNLNVSTLTSGPKSQTVTPFMDVRSATLHELGHILGLAHCDQGVAAGKNYAYFDSMGNRGTGTVGSGSLEVYGPPGVNDYDAGQNYYIDYLYGGVGYLGQVGSWGQEVMSQYSSQGAYTSTPIFGRQPGEINHILSWDELDGYYFLYGTSPLVFTPADSEGTADLVIYGGPIYDLTTGILDLSAVCQGLPLGVPKNPSDLSQGIVIQQAQIYYNVASPTQIGYGTAGFNFDVHANTGWNIYSVALDLVGTENTTLAGPTFDNFGWYQGNPAYQFQPGVPFYPGDPNLKDEIGVKWSHSASPIPPGPSGPVIHVGVTPDVWDWTDFSMTATFFDNRVPIPDSLTIPTAPVHVFSAANVAGGFADTTRPSSRITGACLTSVASSNSVGVSGLAITAPATANPTLVYNMQVADVTGMGLSLSNLNSIELGSLQANDRMITIDNFGSNTLNSGQQFVVVLQGDTNDLPSDIASNNLYAMDLSLSNLVNRELFAVVTSTDGKSVVQNYSLLNSPSIVAPVQSNLNFTAPNIASATPLGSGAIQLGFSSSNVPPLFYVMSTTNVALPQADWTIRGMASNTGPGQFQFTDPKATDQQRFYRLRWMLSGTQ